MLVFASVHAQGEQSFRGLIVAPEHRCSPYDRADYPYPQSVELSIIEHFNGLIYGPYTGTCFQTRYDTDIEHIVSLVEAHDSGLCAAPPSVKRRFARDLLNLTLASPAVNRGQKSAKDLSEWLPSMNRCWYAKRTLEVRRKYALTIDRDEAAAIERILSKCPATTMIVDCKTRQGTQKDGTREAHRKTPHGRFNRNAVLDKYDDNRNGRITCSEARRHGIAPVHKSHPAYVFMQDGDGDGTVCE